MEVYISKITDKGNKIINEDFFGFDKHKENHCFAIADGLGGHTAGDLASNIAVNTILQSFRNSTYPLLDNIKSYLEDAQKELLSIQNSSLKYKTMRTTINLLLIEEDQAQWAHLGDSRLYFFRANKINFQTKDHSVPQALVNAGEISTKEIRFHEDRNRLLRALGDPASFKPQIGAPIKLQKGDKFLLCTDGFWEYVCEDEMEQTLNLCNSPSEWLEIMERLLISHKKQDNDNYTAMAVFIL